MADAAAIIGVVGGVVGLIGGGGGLFGIWRGLREEGRDQKQVLWNSYDKRIELAKARGDKETANLVSVEYDQQLRAWQAQQGFVKIAPTQISAVGEQPSLAPAEVEQLKRLLDQSRSLSSALLSARDFFLRGNTYYEIGKYDAALEAYNRALELRPDDPETLNNRGKAFGNLGRNDEALADFNRALQLRPDDPDTLTNQGVSLERLGRNEDALAAHSRSLQLRPDHPMTLNNRGAALGHLGRNKEALDDYNRALQLRPDDPRTLNNLGARLLRLGRYDQALTDFNRGLQFRSDDSRLLYNRACLYSLQNNADDALHDLSRAIAGDLNLRATARTDKDFDNIRSDPRFQELVGGDQPPDSAEQPS